MEAAVVKEEEEATAWRRRQGAAKEEEVAMAGRRRQDAAKNTEILVKKEKWLVRVNKSKFFLE